MKKKLALALIIISSMVMLFSRNSMAAVTYMPDVNSKMSNPAFWSEKEAEPDKVLATEEQIKSINKSILKTPSTMTHDLAGWSRMSFNGITLVKQLKQSALDDAKYLYDQWARYDLAGNYYATWEEARKGLYGPMIDNVEDPAASENMKTKFGIVVNRSCILTFPSEEGLLDDPGDPDFDYQYQTMVRVNEPVIVQTKSADGKYYNVISSCTSGWLPARDLAICKDKTQWLKAWNFDSKKTLVVYDDKIYTEDSRFAPETANRKLPMGTCLQLADKSEWSGLITNRSAYNNHVVWMPVRKADGSYDKKLALISEHHKVSEGFLPLTATNISKVAMNQLGDAYGWGGMLGSDDCSGYVRDVYKCFGLELARNTTWQVNQPVKNFNIEKKTDKEKIEIIKKMPLGSVLFFGGHEMLYLGEDGGKLYVISSVSNVMINDVRTRIRGGVINTLDIKRSSGKTWLQALTDAQVPFLLPSQNLPARKTNTVKSDDKKTDTAKTKALDEGTSQKSAEKLVIATSFEGPLSGSEYRPLCLKTTGQKNTSVSLSWKKVSGAAKYVVYAGKCGKGNRLYKISETKKLKLKVSKIQGNKLKKNTYYKFMVIAYDSNNKVKSSSLLIHVATKGGKYGNYKSIKSRVSGNTLKLKKGKKYKLSAKGVPASKKKVKVHAGLAYLSTNSKIASVSKKGVVKAVSKGTCYVYIYAQDGTSKRIKVKVTK